MITLCAACDNFIAGEFGNALPLVCPYCGAPLHWTSEENEISTASAKPLVDFTLTFPMTESLERAFGEVLQPLIGIAVNPETLRTYLKDVLIIRGDDNKAIYPMLYKSTPVIELMIVPPGTYWMVKSQETWDLLVKFAEYEQHKIERDKESERQKGIQASAENKEEIPKTDDQVH